MLEAVFFDLDGTLADTALDLGQALNQLLIAENQPTIEIDLVRQIASQGVRGLLELGFNIDEQDSEYIRLKTTFLKNYHHCFADQTVLFPGINTVIKCLNNHDLKWGIITNKPQLFTTPLVEHLQFFVPPLVVVSGDTTTESKPSIKPMLYACEKAQVNSTNCLYVGDAKRDIEAGQKASMKTVLALWGYLTAEEKLENWQADYVINEPLALLDIIKKNL